MEQTPGTLHKQTPSYKTIGFWITPLAIVLAGLFIGLGIFLSGNSDKTISPKKELKQVVQGLSKQAQSVGVDKKAFNQCLEASQYDRVARDLDSGIALGVTGTPFSVVVFPNGQRVPVSGARDQATFEEVIRTRRAPADQPAITLGDFLPVDPEIDHIRGTVDAPITIIEYSDIDCPFCKMLHPTLQSLVASRNDVRWVHRHFPITSLHPYAGIKAEATECVNLLAGSDAFWNYLDGLMVQ